MQTARVVRVYNRNIPEGITEAEFTQKGGLLAGSGASTFGELPPGNTGEYLTPDSAEPLGLKWETPTITVDDTTNHLINGGFNFAQRQTPGTLTTIADLGYGADRWKMTRENADLQYVRQDASSETGLTSPYYGQFKKITNAGKLLLCQPLEYMDTLKFRGKAINFQLQMKASAAKTIKIAIVELQAAGTKDTLPAVVSAWGVDGTDPTLGTNLATIGTPVSCSVTTAWQTFQFTGTFPATAKNLLVMVWSDADFAANDTISLAEAGLYFGSSQRSWTPRPIHLDLAMCQRYYEKSYNIDIAPGVGSYLGSNYFIPSSAAVEIYFRFGVRKRTSPTVTIYSPATTGTSGAIRNVTASTDLTSVTDGGASGEVGSMAYKATGATAGNEYTFHWTAAAEL